MLPPGDIQVQFFTENLPARPSAPGSGEVPIVRRGNLNVTDRFLTILDCRAYPEGGAHAAFLEQHLMGWGGST